jgi:hypothetical protein
VIVEWIDVWKNLPPVKLKVIVAGPCTKSIEYYSHTLKETKYTIKHEIFKEVDNNAYWIPHWVTHWMYIPDDNYKGWHIDDIPPKYKHVITITNKGPIDMYHGHGNKTGNWGWMRGGEDVIVYKWMYYPPSPHCKEIEKHNRDNIMVKKLLKLIA